MRTFKRLHPVTLHSVALLTLLGGQALAEDGDETDSATSPQVRVGAFIGGNYLSSENELGNSYHPDQVPESGFLFGLRGGYLVLDSIAPDSYLNPQLVLELEGKLTISSTAGNASRDSISTPVLGWRANVLLDMVPDQKLVPFVLVGMGGETVFGENKFMTSPDTDFATYWGGGARYALTDAIDLRGDLRIGFTAAREDSLSLLSELHVGISYNFGGSSPEREEEEEPATPDAPKSSDSDHDGIPDDEDACPELAEIMNGIDDKDGCPEIDSDHDGLLGSLDQCPAAAEDIDGFEDDDGCPEPDNDKDGRPDVIDQCPGKPETLNGFEDEDGCPDEVPAEVAKFTGAIKGIQFKTGSARILRHSRKTLDAAFEVMKQNPSIRIEVSGHTDNKGKDNSNRILSRKRADFVKWYLVDKGINADRVQTVGHGPDKPTGDNDTRAGRQENRRIEFKLLPGSATVAGPDEKTSEPAVPVESATPKPETKD